MVLGGLGQKQPGGDAPDTGRGRSALSILSRKQAGRSPEHFRLLKMQFIDSFSECLLSISWARARLGSGDNDDG